MTPERDLWQAVLERAVADALYIGMEPYSLLEKAQAHAWIMGGGEEFQRVCIYAGFSPEAIRDRYAKNQIKPRHPRGRQKRTLPDDFSLTHFFV